MPHTLPYLPPRKAVFHYFPVGATLVQQQQPSPRLSAGHLLVGGGALGKRNGSIDQRRLEGALLEDGRESLEQRGRCGRIALAGVDPEQPALIVIEVQK